MSWSPLTTALVIAGVWVGIGLLVAWLVGRWFRYVRGDSDDEGC